MDADRSEADQGDVERTALAGERTMLAWWRTALAALAVALAVGRFLPEIAAVNHTWPYVALGLGFAAYAAGLFVFGAMRGGVGRYPVSRGSFVAAVFGTLLALGTIALIAAQ
jgi:inner membrane protein YidH